MTIQARKLVALCVSALVCCTLCGCQPDNRPKNLRPYLPESTQQSRAIRQHFQSNWHKLAANKGLNKKVEQHRKHLESPWSN